LQAFVHQLVEQLYKIKIQQLHTGTTNTSEPQNSENANQNSNKSHSHTKRMHLNSFGENSTPSRSQQESEDTIHSNLAHLLAAIESKNAFYLIFPYQRFTLFDATVHSPAMFGDSVAKPLFVLYQLLQLLNHCHGKGITLGELGLKSVFVDTRLWVKVRPPLSVFCGREVTVTNDDRSKALAGGGEECGDGGQGQPTEPHISDVGSSSLITSSSNALALASPSKASGSPFSKAGDTSPLLLPDLSLSEATQKWRVGCLSNFDYLMILNLHAGRSAGDPNNHPIFPWVMDFTHPDGGYRDLAKSKHRLNKGDEQLDFTYLAAQEELKRAAPDQDTLVPHHISDISSDVTYYVYLARKTPKEVLCSRVRPRWVPEEYPASLEKMYIWTPDECIPEFFTDASLFRSIHPDLPDLALPSWCQSPEEMIGLHRRYVRKILALLYWLSI
jgi:WD repeat-containing protein 81